MHCITYNTLRISKKPLQLSQQKNYGVVNIILQSMVSMIIMLPCYLNRIILSIRVHYLPRVSIVRNVLYESSIRSSKSAVFDLLFFRPDSSAHWLPCFDVRPNIAGFLLSYGVSQLPKTLFFDIKYYKVHLRYYAYFHDLPSMPAVIFIAIKRAIVWQNTIQSVVGDK